MLDLEEVLNDAVGPIDLSFSLDDVVGRGKAKRRVRRARLVTSRVAALVVFVMCVAFVGTRLSPEPSDQVAAQLDNAPTSRFVKPGADSDAVAHLPTIFDQEPLTRAAWPIGIVWQLTDTSEVWEIVDSDADESVYLALDLVRNRSCLVSPRGAAFRSDLGPCVRLVDLANSWALIRAGVNPDSALVTFELQGDHLTQAAADVGATVTRGLIRPDPLGPSDAVVKAMTARALDGGPIVVNASPPSARIVVSGRERLFTSRPFLRCLRTDHALQASIGLPEGTMTVTAGAGTGLVDDSISFDEDKSVFAGLFPTRGDYRSIIFMTPDASATDLAEVAAVLHAHPNIGAFEYFDQQDAFLEFKEMFADNEPFRSSVDVADLPASFRLSGDLGDIATIVENMTGVFEVVAPREHFPLMDQSIDTATIAGAVDGSGPIIYAGYQTGRTNEPGTQVVEIVIECGRHFLDARTTDQAARGTTLSGAPVPAIGERVGQLRIPSIEVDIDVVRGVDASALRQGGGSYPSTTLPGHTGNAAIAAHRTTNGAPFLRLDELDSGDMIVTTTSDRSSLYRVTASEVVDRSAVQVLDEYGDDRLTLTSEHPAYGSDQRIVVTAKLLGAPRPAIEGSELQAHPAALE